MAYDGGLNHLHVQLLPRYAGEPVGSKRLVAPRFSLQRGEEQAAAIRGALGSTMHAASAPDKRASDLQRGVG
ncbi:MAG: hypothetical protein M3N47_05050 [Chloroflexota bacterium]|nr:hypothetical protein [Chloroflexota bacterium]